MELREATEQPRNLRQLIVERVRSAIVSGRVPNGTIYSVPTMAAELSVSTTPVREALLELSQDGFLTPLRNRGFRVEPMSLSELDNLFDLRVVLEAFALQSIARQGLKDSAPLRSLADSVADAVGRSDVDGYVEADRAFHHAFVQRANNPLLTNMIMKLRDNMRLYGIKSPAGEERQRASVGEHYRLIDFAEQGAVEEIGLLIGTHINDWRPIFRAALSETLRVD